MRSIRLGFLVLSIALLWGNLIVIDAASIPGIIHNGPRDSNEVALTFDDGPDNQYTEKVLDILKENQVKATFFVVGEMAQKYPTTLERIVAEGHIVGNHSYTHPHFTKIPEDQFLKEVDHQLDDTNKLVFEKTGKQMNLFRTPYGDINNQLISLFNNKGFDIIHWDVDPRDWDRTKTPEDIISTIEQETKPGSIILMHSSPWINQGNIKALPEIIHFLKSKGYSLVTVDQLLHIPAYAA